MKVEAATNLKAYFPSILSIASIILPTIIVYRHDLEILASEALQNEALGHILLIPFLAGILFYLKRDVVKASYAIQRQPKRGLTRYADEIIGASLCLVAFLIYWYGSYTFNPLEYHLLSLPIFLFGITFFLYNGKAATASAIPIAFLFFLIPPPAKSIYTLGGVLADFNTQASYNILKTLNLPITLSTAYGPPILVLTTSLGNQISLTIDLACSGIYSLLAFATFAAFLAFITTATPIRKIGVLLIGFTIFDLLNIARITIITSAAYLFGEKLAMSLFHTASGFILIFIGMIITLIISEKFLNVKVLPSRKESPTCPECESLLKINEHFCLNCGNYLKPQTARISRTRAVKLLLLLLACSLVTFSINAPTFAVVTGSLDLSSNPTGEDATKAFPTIPGYQLAFLYRDTDYERLADQDASLMYAYFPSTANKSQSSTYVVVGVADSISNLHNWEVCLISMQTTQGRNPLVTVLEQRDIQLLPEIPVVARYLVFRSPENYTQVTLYWYERATFKTGISVGHKYVRISLVIITENSTPYSQFEDELVSIGKTIASYWEPLKTQSIVSLGIPAQQLLLAVSVTFVAFTKTAQHTSERMKRNNNQKIFDNFASHREKLTLQTIQELAEENKKIETRDIRRTLEKKTEEPVKLEELTTTLNKLEEYGLIRRDVTSVENQPKMIWKT